MGKPFLSEISNLERTFAWAKTIVMSDLVDNLRQSWHLPLFVVGSGGSYSVAEYQATLHKYFFHTIANAITPLDLTYFMPRDRQYSVWFHSASGNNIDILRAFKYAILNEPNNISAVIGKTHSKISKLASDYSSTNLFEYNLPTGKDGFLATNSIIGLATILLNAYCKATQNEILLPETLNELFKGQLVGSGNLDDLKNATNNIWEKDRIHIVYSPLLKSIALDIESKFIESGIASVHLADLRNFAHGRHHWFAKNVHNSSILFLTTKLDYRLGQKTLDLMPTLIPKYNLIIKNDLCLGLLAGLLLSIYFTFWRAQKISIDPGKPGVPEYGSKIYHLTTNIDKDFESINTCNIAVKRKIINYGQINIDVAFWEKAHNDFKKRLAIQKIGAIVLDYDGTIVDRKHKNKPPSREIFNEINRILENGLKIGFATGRGQSIRESLRVDNGIKESFWENVIIGFYNGADIKELSYTKSLDSIENVGNELFNIREILKNSISFQKLNPDYELRKYQIKIEVDSILAENKLWSIVEDELAKFKIPNKIVRSSHSIDILATGVTKLLVVEKLRGMICDGSEVLTIGDRGSWPGNDYDLLSTDLSLSVDEVSYSHLNCWNLCSPGKCGVQGTLSYLKCIEVKDGIGVFNIKRLK